MTIEYIRQSVVGLVDKYPIKKVVLFGSRANGTNRDTSDVDLIIEFYKPITLITLSMIKDELEETLRVDVDVIHGPIREDDMIEIEKEVLLYAA